MEHSTSMIQPQDIDAEQQILGACLMDKEAAETARDILSPADFYISGHSEIFNAILHTLNAGKTPDLLTVKDYLHGRGKLEQIGGVVFLAGLTGKVVSTAFVEQHARIVSAKAIARKMLAATERVKAKAYNGDYETPTELLAFAEAEFSRVEIREQGQLEPVAKLLPGVMIDLEERYRKKSITGIPTGYPLLTVWLAGYQAGDLILLAARPSMGKTTWAVQEAKDMAVRHGKKVAFFSLEMSKRQLIEKLIINEGRVQAQNVRVGRLEAAEWERIGEASTTLMNSGVFIDDSSRMTTADIAHRSRRMKMKHGLDAIFIDYLQLIRSAKKAENKRLEIGEISRELKALAKELNVPVIALSQLSRAVEGRDNKRPVMSDLRESGDLEQDADVIMFLYREEYYMPNTEKKSIAELRLAKQRSGPTGTLEMAWVKEHTKFYNLERQEERSLKVVPDNKPAPIKTQKSKPFWNK